MRMVDGGAVTLLNSAIADVVVLGGSGEAAADDSTDASVKREISRRCNMFFVWLLLKRKFIVLIKYLDIFNLCLKHL